VKFVCKSLKDIGDPELEAKAPMRRDAADIINPCQEAIAGLQLAGDLDVLTNAWLDPNGRGIRCISPPLDADNVKFYDYHIELSLDGRRFLDRGYPFNIYDMRVVGLQPPLGSLTESTEVTIQTTGLVKTEIQEVRLDFPRDLEWPSQRIPAAYDHTTGEVRFRMPDLTREVRLAVDEERNRLGKATAVGEQEGPPQDSTSPEDLAGAVGEIPLGEDAIDLDGGLAGLEVFVELSLNGQNFTEDRVHFTYHAAFEPLRLRVLAPPEGVAVPEEPTKAAKGGAKKTDASDEPPLVLPGSKLSCEVGGLATTEYASLRADIFTKVGEEDAQLLRSIEIPAQIELVAPVRSSPPPEDSKKDKKGEVKEEEEPAAPIEMLVAYAPAILQSSLPDPTAVLYMENFSASLNGQNFVPIKEATTWRLHPQADDQ
jgi:hypothetical protein